jgi:uncharacterized protein DUF6893
MKAVKMLRNVVGTAALLLAGYVLMTSLPDVRRYIRISTM